MSINTVLPGNFWSGSYLFSQSRTGLSIQSFILRNWSLFFYSWICPPIYVYVKLFPEQTKRDATNPRPSRTKTLEKENLSLLGLFWGDQFLTSFFNDFPNNAWTKIIWAKMDSPHTFVPNSPVLLRRLSMFGKCVYGFLRKLSWCVRSK